MISHTYHYLDCSMTQLRKLDRLSGMNFACQTWDGVDDVGKIFLVTEALEDDLYLNEI